MRLGQILSCVIQKGKDMISSIMPKAIKTDFIKDESGGTTMRIALLFGAVGIAFSVLATPFLQTASQQYAAAGGYGVDTVVTGSINSPKKRYTIRKSVLNPNEQRICRNNELC